MFEEDEHRNFLHIDNCKKRKEPPQNTELDEMIFDEGLCRTTAQTEDDHVLQISEQTCKYPNRRQIDITGAHPENHLLRHSVHNITNQCD